ncbi:hypothetical protein JW933_10605 [candidate division FCPU426 bacterium]|nr:hypothetical protein [candidate division FCPU426 bacterium]
MPETFKFTLDDVKIKPKARGNTLPWKILAFLLFLALLGVSYLYIESRIQRALLLSPASGGGQEAEVAAITHTADEFLSRYLTFSATQLEEHQRLLVQLLTAEYADAIKTTWQAPELSRAVKERKVEIFVTTDTPAIIGVNAEGRVFVEVAGKIKVQSAITYIQPLEKKFAGTLSLVKSGQEFKVTNVVWKHTE